jgi:TIR domain
MPSGPGERYDFFLSRRGSVATIAQEVTDVLTEKGYTVFVQDYDIPITANFIEEMHEAIKNAKDLIVLFTRDLAYSLRRHLPEAALGHRVCPQGPRRVLRGDRVAHRIGRLLVL